jgi:hypothetical protein
MDRFEPMSDDELSKLLPSARPIAEHVGASFIATIRDADGAEGRHIIHAGTYDGGRLIAERLAAAQKGILSDFRRAAR